MNENILMEEWFMILFSSFMFGHAVISIQNWLEKDRRSETEIWAEEYKKDVPDVWR